MMKVLVISCCVLLSAELVSSKPANNEQLDKATVNDVAANAVAIPDKFAEQNASDNTTEKKEGPTVQITGITTGIENGGGFSASDSNGTPFKPQKTGSAFARLIDDIFQIPISVLQNVAKLITNPFTQKSHVATSPEAPSV